MTSIAEVCRSMRDVMITKAKEHESQMIKRQRKVTGDNLCQTLVWGWLENPHASLENLCQMGVQCGLEISPQGLEARFTPETAEFLQKILAEMVTYKIKGTAPEVEILQRFSEVNIEDSSIITLPDELHEKWSGCGGSGSASRSSVKLQVRLDVKHGHLDGPYLVHGKTHDSKAAQRHPQQACGALMIRDLGYWKLEELERIATQGGFWLSYLKRDAVVYYQEEWQSIADLIASLPEASLEGDILLGKSKQIPARLLARPVPADIAAERRRKLKRKYQKGGRTPSAARLALCDWLILVTNVPRERLSFDEAVVLVRIRWQIELLFKLWKSHGYIDESVSQNPWRILCECYAKLIGMVFQHWLLVLFLWQHPDRSWVKAAQTIRSFALSFALNFSRLSSFKKIISSLGHSLAHRCRINRSLKYPHTYQLLLQLESNTA